MMSMKKIMEVNATAVAATSVVAKVDPTSSSGLNQINHPTSDMVGHGCKELGSMGDPYFVQIQSKHAFPPYGLPPNYAPPNVVRPPDENVNNSTPILIENQQPRSDHAYVPQLMGETHEIPYHNLVDFEPRFGYAAEGQVVGGVPLPNTLECPQFLPQPQPLYFAAGRIPLAMAEKGKLDHIEERLRVVEGGGSYAFANTAELCLVTNIVIPPKFKVSEFNKYKGTTCPNNHLKMYCKKMGAYTKDQKLLMHFFQESLTGAAITWYTNL